MQFLSATVFLNFIFAISLAQSIAPAPNTRLIKKADSLYKAKDFLNSAHQYSAAFESFNWKGTVTDRYNAACSWALAGVPDSAFSNLQRIAITGNYSNYRHITTDTDLLSLHADPRWKSLLRVVQENKDKSEINFDKALIKLLDSLFAEDQKWRNYMRQHQNNELVNDTTSAKYISEQITRTDSENYFFLRQIFDKHGFPNYDLVGQSGSANFWLLIQHQDSRPQFQEEVLVKMKEEADRGKASPSHYAYLADRVKVNTGHSQVYGTQMRINEAGTSYEPLPVIEPEKLNDRRKSVGLDTIESYIELMNSRYFGSLKN